MSDVYDDDEVHEILQRAIGKRGSTLGLSHSELAEVAAEVGIPIEALEEAAAEVRGERGGKTLMAEARHRLAWKRRRARGRWIGHLVTWAVISMGLTAIDFMAGGGVNWAQWPAVCWGIFVALQGARLVVHDEEADLERERRILVVEREREAKRAAKAAAKRRKRKGLPQAEKAFEAAIEKGLALALNRAAEKIDEVISGKPAKDTDFNRYAAQKEGRPVRVDAQAPTQPAQQAPVRVRAAEMAEDPAEEELAAIERELDRELGLERQ